MVRLPCLGCKYDKNFCQIYKITSGKCGWATEVMNEQSLLRSLRSSVFKGFWSDTNSVGDAHLEVKNPFSLN